MVAKSPESRFDMPPSPNDVRRVELDDVDRRILLELHNDARIPNSALAEAVGIAASTCHGRVRRLQETGVIRGFFTDVDPPRLVGRYRR
ncbi:winged helix-turn-helix DNA-binding family protein [Mycobacteroides abscessus subsp. bolletii 1513]|uniref:Winged helix-turn-helix DNA-binding family protein n=1 Tax=Mycobacteroides abscessus subsp. bolletii 1513 TaxID=1299321 RepID=X8DRE7_9MYCO|nr:winged helix-turn-helix DNA-binding family protein [Mycobacteroides abscessus subsp. bolletii 1513]